MRNALEKLVIPAIILASGHTAVYAHPSEASCQPWQNSGSAATGAAIADGATGVALLSSTTVTSAAFGPMALVASTVTKLVGAAYAVSLPEAEQGAALNRSTAWWTGGAVTNLLLIASAAQPLALLGGLTAGLLTWNGPGSFKLPPPPAPEEGLVANAAAVSSPKVAQSWAVGPEAQVLTSMKPAAPIAPHVVTVAPPTYRAPPPALEF